MKIPKRSYFVISHKERWGLTIWGWFFLIVIITIPLYFLITNLYGILAPVHREKTDILVVEGFVSDEVLNMAIKEFNSKHYSLLITTGTPLEWGHLLIAYENTANIAAASLIKMGFDSTHLVSIGTKEIRNDRTYNSALELRRWLRKNRPATKAINLLTMCVHGGRSRMLFQYALGDSIKVGVISMKSYYYGEHDWWKSSKGFRETINEAIGYFYVRYFFRPYEKEMKLK